MGIQSFPSVGGKSFPEWLATLDSYNDGSDGAYNPGSNQTLTSGIYKFSSLNIPAGVTISPSSNFVVILVKGACQIDGLISASGKGGVAGDFTSIQAYVGGAGGGAGGAGGGNSMGGRAGAGAGAGGGGGGGTSSFASGGGTTAGVAGAGAAGGAGAACVASGAAPAGGAGGSTDINLLHAADSFALWKVYKGAGGGCGGVPSGYTVGMGTGGNGGNGGGVVLIVAPAITGSGAVRADGTAGTSPLTANYGGGGGGGGGLVMAAAASFGSVTMSAAGGAGAAGHTNGGAGGAGGAGYVLKLTR